MKRYVGQRHIKGDIYEISFRPFKGAKRRQFRVRAKSKQDADAKRAEAITNARKEKESDTDNRSGLTFENIWSALERNVIADGLAKKTLSGFRCVYKRLFYEFRSKRFPSITTPEQLNLPFFIEYKSYVAVDLGRSKGLRAEIQRVKSIMHRLRKLRFCSEAIIKDLEELPTPGRNKKEYPEILYTKFKAFMARIKNERPDLYGVIYFMLRTGRRVEETTLIERKDIVWSGIDPVRINIRAETTKTDKYAPLNYLDSDMKAHIRLYYQKSSKHKPVYLFLNRQGKKCDQGMITSYLGELSEEMLGIRITAHHFRHRFCTECGKRNLPMADVMAISGIKTVAILTEYYSHSTNEGQAKVLESTRLM
jgi:integrase